MVLPRLGTDSGRMPLSAPPVPFSPSLNSPLAWYDAGDAGSVNHTSNAVNTLNDLSGNARHISNTSTARPTYDAAGGKIVFNGTTHCLYNSAPFLWARMEKAIYMVANITTGANKRIVGEVSHTGSARYFPLQTGNSGDQLTDICPVVTTDGNSGLIINRTQGASLGGAKKIIRLHEKNGLYLSWINGSVTSRTRGYDRAGATLTPTRFGIGAAATTSPTNFTAMDLFEIIIAGDDTHGEQIEGYLAHKHGLTADLPAGHRYKSSAPLQGDTTNYTPNFTGLPVTAALFGDSLSAQNSGIPGGYQACYINIGHFVDYNQLAGNRMHLPVTPTNYNKGVSGNALSQMISRLSDLDALACDVVVFMGGTNSLSDGIGTLRLNLDTIISYITLTLKKTCIWLTVTPKGTGAENSTIVAVRDYIMSRHGSCEGRIISVNIHDVLDAGGGVPLANSLADSVHYAPYGAMKIGQAMDTALATYFGRNTVNFSTANLLTNGTLTGTGGTGSGQIATGWTFASAGPAPTASKNGSDAQLIASSFTATGAGTNTWEFKQAITSGYSNGDTIYAAALVEVTSPANIAKVQLEMRLAPNAVQTVYESIGNKGQNGQVPETYATFGQYVIVTPALTLTTGSVTGITVRLYQENDANAVSTTSNVTIKGIGLFKK